MALIRILIVPGSNRSGSLNKRLAAVAVEAFARRDVEVSLISLADYPLPLYDGDLEMRSGVPVEAVNLKRTIAAHHGVLIVTPEYNSAPPPLLKNAIDWVTRVAERGETQGEVFRTRPFALASASDGKLGGARALAALRLILAGCRATVIGNQLALSFASEAYDERERLKHAADAQALDAMAHQLVDFAQQMK